MMNKKIKVLILTHTFPTKYNPVAAIFLLNQLEELKKYCEIKVIYPFGYVPSIKWINPYYRFSKVPFHEKIKGLDIYHPKYLMIPRILFKQKLLNIYLSIESCFSYLNSKKLTEKVVGEWNPDVIHMHGSFSEGFMAKNLKRRFQKPLLITVYGEDITMFGKQHPSSYLVKKSLNYADAIICQSKFLQSEIESIGITNKKFFIIPMGVLTTRFKPENQNKIKRYLNLPLNKKIILFVGHLVPRKGVEYLIKSIKFIVKKNQNILCLIIGKGYQEEYLKKMINDMKLDSYIEFLGEKDNQEVPNYMNACDVLALPSLNEGLPVVLCEALACGKPVVATRVAGTPELVNNDVGYLVNPKEDRELAEKILLALNKKWDKRKLLKRAKEFSVKASVEKLVKVYKSFY